MAKSFLLRRDGPGDEPRFDMLETIREFGLEQLTEGGELEAMRRWHPGYYLAMAEEAEPHLRGAGQRRWLKQLETEQDNLRAALEWALTTDAGDEKALRLSGALAWFWSDRGYTSEGRRWLDRALATGTGSEPARLKALCGAGWLAHVQRERAGRACVSRARGGPGRPARRPLGAGLGKPPPRAGGLLRW